MEKKQTAVEWLEEQITKKDCGDLPMYVYNLIEQAQELEKQQIVDAVDGHPIQNRNLDGEQYYTTTYGKE